MNLTDYQSITGIDVADSGRITAQINRVQYMLENLLGYTFDPELVTENLYNELGKTQQECSCLNVDTENLDDPDEVVGAYRLYDYNDKDQFLHLDPFTAIHAVKLVKNNVTIRTFETREYSIRYGKGGVAKYLDVNCNNCFCVCKCTDCVQLAVDADWLYTDDLPNDLLSVWADMVTFYGDQRNGIKSESLDTHSYTKFDRTAPETESMNLTILRKYAGPYGSVSRNPTV